MLLSVRDGAGVGREHAQDDLGPLLRRHPDPPCLGRAHQGRPGMGELHRDDEGDVAPHEPARRRGHDARFHGHRRWSASTTRSGPPSQPRSCSNGRPRTAGSRSARSSRCRFPPSPFPHVNDTEQFVDQITRFSVQVLSGQDPGGQVSSTANKAQARLREGPHAEARHAEKLQSASPPALRSVRPAVEAAPHQRPAVVWLTGPSGAGKTTIARELEVELRSRGLMVGMLDGDDLRAGLCNGPGLLRRRPRREHPPRGGGSTFDDPRRADRDRLTDLAVPHRPSAGAGTIRAG